MEKVGAKFFMSSEKVVMSDGVKIIIINERTGDRIELNERDREILLGFFDFIETKELMGLLSKAS